MCSQDLLNGGRRGLRKVGIDTLYSEGLVAPGGDAVGLQLLNDLLFQLRRIRGLQVNCLVTATALDFRRPALENMPDLRRCSEADYRGRDSDRHDGCASATHVRPARC